jgi:hypothetical protein
MSASSLIALFAIVMTIFMLTIAHMTTDLQNEDRQKCAAKGFNSITIDRNVHLFCIDKERRIILP